MRTFLIISFLLSSLFCSAQDEILLENPSFEDFPKLSHTPTGWYNCGFPGESAVDVHPVPGSEFQVDKLAADGQSYLGMITRENETWEAIGQRLSQPLLGGKAYSFSIDLARSVTYISGLRNSSMSQNSVNKLNFSTPIKLRIWGGDGYCQKGELLAESPLISNSDWQSFDFTLNPKYNLHYIVFEAFYEVPCPFPYNGNILLDKASSFLEIKNQEFIIEDSIRLAYLDSLDNTQIFTATQVEKDLREQEIPKTGAKSKIVIKPNPKPSKQIVFNETVLNQKDRTFLKEQLAFVNFENNSRYLENKSVDAIIEIVKKINEFDEEFKISFYIKAPDKSWEKGRGKEVLSLFVEAGIPRNNIRISRTIPSVHKVHFRGGDSDIYFCLYL